MVSIDILESNMVYEDLTIEELINKAIENKEGLIAANQALSVTTGNRTGRSPKDRFIVHESTTADNIDWGEVNQPIDAQNAENLWQKVWDYMSERDQYIAHCQVGADEHFNIPVKVINEMAWHNIFAQQLFIREKSARSGISEEWTILHAPNYKADPTVDKTNSSAAIIFHISKRRILICGSLYAGEIKKSMFSIMNYLLTDHGILPMHCAANSGKEGDVALFFGLSGTGKTTLSADPSRYLIGDDEHGWSDHNVFNFEGGCYAKCIDLSPEKEPVIWDAIRRGCVMENVVLDENGVPNYSDSSLTSNSRAAYPREHIELRVPENQGKTPSSVLFLTCDLYGVLPPVSILNKEQAAYYFLSGYTALVGSTEVGQGAGVKPTFSTCFGAPFFPRYPNVYADLLIQHIEKTGAQVYLVNTGWTGGPHGEGGERFSIPTTRAIVSAIINQKIDLNNTETLPIFNLTIPRAVENVDSKLLNPINTWANSENYNNKARELSGQFIENFKRFNVSDLIVNAGPVEG